MVVHYSRVGSVAGGKESRTEFFEARLIVLYCTVMSGPVHEKRCEMKFVLLLLIEVLTPTDKQLREWLILPQP